MHEAALPMARPALPDELATGRILVILDELADRAGRLRAAVDTVPHQGVQS